MNRAPRFLTRAAHSFIDYYSRTFLQTDCLRMENVLYSVYILKDEGRDIWKS